MDKTKVTDYTQYLKAGKENAISGKELAFMLGFSGVRALQNDLAKSREAGQVILSSSSGGYYLHSSIDELREFVGVMSTRACSTIKVLKSARELLKELEVEESGQMHIDDYRMEQKFDSEVDMSILERLK